MTVTADDKHKLSTEEIAAGMPSDFRHMPGQLMARYRVADFAAAQELADQIGRLAEEAGHHPDLLLGWGYLEVRLSSHDVGGITRRDLRLARQVSAAAGEAGAHPEPAALQVVDWGLDTWSDAAVLPFWRAILGYGDAHHEGELVDPSGRGGPTVWFQDTDEHDTPRQRFHPDIWVPVDEAQPRIEAALAAGGTLVSDDRAPRFWVLADPQGNRVCICTVQQRAW
jgi:4a-hydroxytetrahydrobiopterin dehydratase